MLSLGYARLVLMMDERGIIASSLFAQVIMSECIIVFYDVPAIRSDIFVLCILKTFIL